MKPYSVFVVMFSLLLGLFCQVSYAQTPEQLKQLHAYPAAGEFQRRAVIWLEDKGREAEAELKIELLPGKIALLDSVNNHRVGLKLSTETIKGWGYSLYRVVGSDRVASTMMAVPPEATAVEQFIAGQPLLINYNSRLPVVVYMRKGLSLQYRIWQAGEWQQAPASSAHAKTK